MRRPILLLAVTMCGFAFAYALFGYRAVYSVGYGAFALLAAVIAATFFWLWHQRSTPLALGMGFGWLGASSITGWWWFNNLSGDPVWMDENPVLFVFLSVYLVGAMMHLALIGRSFSMPTYTEYFPVVAAIAVSFAVTLIF